MSEYPLNAKIDDGRIFRKLKRQNSEKVLKRSWNFYKIVDEKVLNYNQKVKQQSYKELLTECIVRNFQTLLFIYVV